MLCVNSRGDAWTEMGLSSSMRKFFLDREKRGLADPGLTMHGLRHRAAAELKSQSYTPRSDQGITLDRKPPKWPIIILHPQTYLGS